MIRLIAVLITLILVSGEALATPITREDLGALSATELFQLSDRLPGAEKYQVRKYLAGKYPDSDDGLYSLAQYQSNTGNEDEALKLLRQLVQRNPRHRFAPAYLASKLGDSTEDELEKRRLLEPAATDSGTSYYTAQSYFNLLNKTLNDTAAANLYIEQLLSNPDNAAIGHFLRAGLLEDAGNLDGAIDEITNCLLTDDFYCPRNYIIYVLRDGKKKQQSAKEKAMRMQPALKAAQTHLNSELLNYVGDVIRRDLESPGVATQYYELAYDIQPTATYAYNYYRTVRKEDPETAVDFLVDALDDLENNWELLSRLAVVSYDLNGDYEAAKHYAEESLKFPYKESDISTVLDRYNDLYNSIGDFETADRVNRRFLPQLSGSARMKLLQIMAVNRYRANDLVAMEALLDETKGKEFTNASKIDLAYRKLSNAKNLQQQRSAFYRDNQFLGQWESEFGTSLGLAVVFETNSSTIQPQSYSALDSAARILKAREASKYLFVIEGHTDSVGGREFNQNLSQRRSDAVRNYFVEQHGISRARLTSRGYGLDFPVAANTTEAGRQANRRVEIRPFGNISEPEIATSSTTERGGWFAVSPDGRLAALGAGPIEIWDLQAGLKIRELFRGVPKSFSPSGRFLAAYSSWKYDNGQTEKVLYIYDVKTGLLKTSFEGDFAFRQFSWAPDETRLAVATDNSEIRVFDIQEGRQTGVAKVAGGHKATGVFWSNDGTQIFQTLGTVGRVYVRDARSLSLIKTLEAGSWVFAAGQTRDGKLTFAFENSRKLYVWDTETWQLLRTIQLPYGGSNWSAHPAKHEIAFPHPDHTRKNSVEMIVIDLDAGRVTAQTDTVSSSPQYSPDGRNVITTDGDTILWLDSSTLEVTRSLKGQTAKPLSLALDKKFDQLISQDTEGTSIWSLKTMRQVHFIREKVVLPWVDIEGGRFVSVDEENYLVTLDSSDFSFKQVARTRVDEPKKLHVSDRYVVIVGTVFNDKTRKHMADIEVFERRTLRSLASYQLDIVTSRLTRGQSYAPRILSLSVSDEQDLLAFASSWKDGYATSYTKYNEVVRLFDLTTGELRESHSRNHKFDEVEFVSDPVSSLRVRNPGYGWYTLDIASGEQLSYEQLSDDSTVIQLANGGELKFSSSEIEASGRKVIFNSNLRDVVLYESKNLVIAHTKTNEIIFYDLNTLTEQLTLTQRNNGEWLAHTPDGYFTSSMYGRDGVYWSLGDYYLPFSAMSKDFEKPLIIQQRLEEMMEGGSVVTPVKPEVDPEIFNPPYKVVVESQSEQEVSGEEFQLVVRVAKDDTQLPDPELVYYLNERPLRQARGFEEEPFYESNESVTFKKKIQLSEGRNDIQVALLYKGKELQKQSIVVTRTVAPRPIQVVNGTQLWFFGVGVSDYEIATQNLEYAHADAESLAQSFSAQEGKLYGKVNTKVLTNDQATEKNIRIEMHEFLKMASSQDVIVLFIAGHGIQDNEQNLYFVSYDADLNRPYTGMEVDKFRKFLDSRPINQKALFLMDICHAGTVGPRRRGLVTVNDAIQQLAAGTGTVVLASSTGAQSSFEDESFSGGHGAFTAALLEGLDGQADTVSGDRNGAISLQELIGFISRRVPQLTDGQQHPTVPRAENVRDFPLAVAQ